MLNPNPKLQRPNLSPKHFHNDRAGHWAGDVSKSAIPPHSSAARTMLQKTVNDDIQVRTAAISVLRSTMDEF